MFPHVMEVKYPLRAFISCGIMDFEHILFFVTQTFRHFNVSLKSGGYSSHGYIKCINSLF